MFGAVDEEYVDKQMMTARNSSFEFDYKPSWTEGAWSTAVQTFKDETTIGAVYKKTELDELDAGPGTFRFGMDVSKKDNDIYNKEQFDSIQVDGLTPEQLGVKYEDGHRKLYWEAVTQRAYDRYMTEQKSSSLGGVSKFGVAMATQFLDPINYIPFAGPVGKTASLGRRMVMGGFEAAVGNVVVDLAAVRPGYKAEGIDYDIDQVALNALMGAVAGTTIAGVGHGIQSAMRRKVHTDVAGGKDVDVTPTIKDPLEAMDRVQAQDAFIDDIPMTEAKQTFMGNMDRTDVVNTIERLEAEGNAKGYVGSFGGMFDVLNKNQALTDKVTADVTNLPSMLSTASPTEIVNKLGRTMLDIMEKTNDPDLAAARAFFDNDNMLWNTYANYHATGAVPYAEAGRVLDKITDYIMSARTTALKNGAVEHVVNKAFFDKLADKMNTLKPASRLNPDMQTRQDIQQMTGEPEQMDLDDAEFQRQMEHLDAAAQQTAYMNDIRLQAAGDNAINGLRKMRDVFDKEAFNREMYLALGKINEEYTAMIKRGDVRPVDAKNLSDYHANIENRGKLKANLIEAVYQCLGKGSNGKACKDELIKRLIGLESAYDENELIEIVETMFDNYVAKKDLNLVYNEMLQQNTTDMISEYRTRAQQVVRLSNLEKMLERFAQAHPDRTKAEGLMAAMGGSERPIEGAMRSVDAISKGKKAKYLGAGILKDIDNANLMKAFAKADEDFELKIAQELWQVDNNGKAARVTGDADAAKLAEIIHKWQKIMVGELNSQGATIRWLPGYIVRQTHNTKKLRGKVSGKKIIRKDVDYQKAMTAWRDKIKQHLDIQRTFDDPTITPKQLDKKLEDIYVRLITGQHMTANLAGKTLDDVDRTLGAKLGAHRKLHFKSAEDWFEYNKVYGSKSLFDAVLTGFSRGAQNIALMKMFGPDPEMVFNTIMNRLRREAATNPNLAKDLNKSVVGPGERNLRNLFDELTGSTHMVENENLANVDAFLRGWNNMTSLGSATISAVSDAPLFVMAARRMGVPVLKAIDQFVRKDFLDVLATESRATRNEVAQSVGVGVEGMLGEIAKRFSYTESGHGMAKAQRMFFKATGLQAWTDAHKKGWVHMLTNHTANMLDKTFDQLKGSRKYSDFHEMLVKYGFNADDWAKMQKAAVSDIGGRRFLLPQNIEDVELREMYRTFLIDSADTAVITPGAKEAAFMNQGTRPGTVLGTATRMFFQFKSFPLTLYSRVFKGMAQRGQLGGRGFSGMVENMWANKTSLFTTALAMTVMGGVGSALKDYSRGRQPRIYGGMETIADGTMDWERINQSFALAVMQGGAMGLLGDTFMGLGQDYGTGMVSQFLGPTPGKVIEGAKLGYDSIDSLIQMAYDNPTGGVSSARAVWFMKNNIPFQNHFALRGLLDMYGTYAVLEAFEPGYLAKMENKYYEQWGTGFSSPMYWGPINVPIIGMGPDESYTPSDVVYNTYY